MLVCNFSTKPILTRCLVTWQSWVPLNEFYVQKTICRKEKPSRSDVILNCIQNKKKYLKSGCFITTYGN